MAQEILAVAIYQPLAGMEESSLVTMRDLLAILSAKGYSRDSLFRDDEGNYVLLRYWESDESRRSAQEDPEVQRCWAKLGNEIQILKVYERLENVPLDEAK
jgi:hypothetical protein